MRLDAVQWGQQIADKTVGKIAGVWQLNNSTPNAATTADPDGDGVKNLQE